MVFAAFYYEHLVKSFLESDWLLVQEWKYWCVYIFWFVSVMVWRIYCFIFVCQQDTSWDY